VIEVEARLRAVGAEFRPEGAARTDGTGRFTYTAPAGASRTLRFRYQGSNTDRPTFSDMDVSVPAALTLKANKKRVAKKSVRFSGALLGAPLPPGGVKVDLQVYYRKKWRTFATPRTDAAGAFSYRYRFQTVKGVAVFAFRARLKPEAAYPYDLGDSRKVKVRVRGR
jgi:hypothetical protein